MAAETLMFEIGVKTVGKKLSDIERELAEFVGKYKDPIKIKIDIQEASGLLDALKKIGGAADKIKPLEKQLENLNSTLATLSKTGTGVNIGGGMMSQIDDLIAKIAKAEQAFKAFNNETATAAERAHHSALGVQISQARNTLTSQFGLSKENIDFLLNDYYNKAARSAQQASQQTKEYEQRIASLSAKITELEGKINAGNTGNTKTVLSLDPETIRQVTDAINTLKTAVEQLKLTMAKVAETDAIRNMLNELQKYKERVDSLEARLKNATIDMNGKGGLARELKNYDTLLHNLNRVSEAYTQLNQIRHAAQNAGLDTTRIEERMQKLLEYRRAIKDLMSGDLRDKDLLRTAMFDGQLMFGKVNSTNYLVSLQSEIKALIRQYDELIKKQREATNSSSSGSGLPKGSLAQHLGQGLSQAATEMDRNREKIARIIKQIHDAYDTLRNNRIQGKRDFGLSLPDISKLQKDMNRIFATLSAARKTGIIDNTDIDAARTLLGIIEKITSEQRKANVKAGAGQYSQDTSATQQNTQAKNENAAATKRQTQEYQQLVAQLQLSTGAMRNQSQVMSDLKSMAAQYLSLWGAQSFVNNIIETGGQLERQRLSMGAILSDAQKANVLFDQIKDLAVKSPFGVVELDQYSKQLAAYGFQYHELFDMTKRLADISAGAGTDISRIALALGHVRAEGALTGYTLRQFAMNNIPMLKMLSERLSEIEGKLVTTAEIRKRVHDKKIGYEDVEAVIKQLTDEGGMFYQMQEVISQSVSAKWKNLRDSLDIMYGEMAESSVGGGLKTLAETLMHLTRNWKSFMAAVVSGGTVFGLMRAKTLLMNFAMKRSIAVNLASAASWQALSAQELENMALSGALTRQDLALAVASGKVSVANAIQAGSHLGLSEAQLKNLASSRSLMGGIKGVGGALAGLLSPANLAIAAIMALTAAYMRWSAYRDSVDQKTQESMDNIRSQINDIEKAQKQYTPESKPNNDLGLKQSIDDMKTILANSKAYTKELDEQLSSTKSMSKQYDILSENIKKATSYARAMLAVQKEAGELIKAGEGGLENWLDWAKGLGETFGGILGQVGLIADLIANGFDFSKTGLGEMSNQVSIDDVGKNMSDVENKDSAFTLRIQDAQQYESTLDNVIAKMVETKEVDASFAKQVQNATWDEKIRMLAESGYWDKIVAQMKKADSGFAVHADNIKNALDGVNSAWEDVRVNIGFQVKKMMEDRNMDEQQLRNWAMNNTTELNNMLDAMLDQMGVKGNALREHFKMMFMDFITMGDAFEKFKKLLADEVANGFKGDYKDSAAWVWFEEQMKAGQDKMNAEIKKAGSTTSPTQSSTPPASTDKKKGNSKKDPHPAEKDPEAEKWKERIRQIKEARKLYEQWYDMTHSKVYALSRVQERFKDLLGADDINKLSTLQGYSDVLETVKQEALKRLSGKTTEKKTKNAKEVIRQIIDEQEQISLSIVKDDSETFKSRLEREVRAKKERWDIFSNIRKSVGDTAAARMASFMLSDLELAPAIAGRNPKRYVSALNNADALRQYIELKGMEGGLDIQGSDIWDKIFNMSDKELGEYVADSVFRPLLEGKEGFANENIDVYKDKIQGLVYLLREWQKLQEDAIKSNTTEMAKLLGDTKDYVTELKKAIQEHDDVIRKATDLNNVYHNDKKINPDGNPRGLSDNQLGQIMEIANVTLETKKLKLSFDYINFMNNAIGMTYEEAKKTAKEIKDNLNKQFKIGRITAAEYADGIRKINDIEKELTEREYKIPSLNEAFKMRFERGLQLYTKGKDASQRGGALFDLGVETGDAKMKAQGIEMSKNGKEWMAKGQAMMQGAQKAQGAIAIIDTIINGLNQAAQAINNIADKFADMYDALGDEDKAANWRGKFSAVSAFTGNMASAWNSAKEGDIGGTVTGIVGMYTDTVTAIAKRHDDKLANRIKKIDRRLQQINNQLETIKSIRENSLGYANDDNIRQALAAQYAESRTWYNTAWRKAMYDYYMRGYKGSQEGMENSQSGWHKGSQSWYSDNSLGSGRGRGWQDEQISMYAIELAALEEKREEIANKYETEKKKKKEDKEALESYLKEISDLDMQILNFGEDLAKELWNLDIKGWASQIGDALMEAFENGESAARAFDDAARNIMQSVVNEMLRVGIIEPMLQDLRDTIFGKVGEDGKRTQGVFDYNNPEASVGAVLETLGDFFGDGGEGRAMIAAAQEFTEGANRLLGNYGLSLKTSSSSQSTTNGIQSQATEESIGIVSGQLARIAQDVSVKRIMQTMFVNELWPDYIKRFDAQKMVLDNTFASVRAIEVMMRDGEGALYDRINRTATLLESAYDYGTRAIRMA